MRKARPILFSGEMVRALMAGTKTQTRRVLKNPEFFGCPTGDCPHNYTTECIEGMQQNVIDCPYGKVGDLLWVRESIYRLGYWQRVVDDIGVWLVTWVDSQKVAYMADDVPPRFEGRIWRSFPSIHMPKVASRLTLEITGVRLELLRDISLEDAMAEGWPDSQAAEKLQPKAWYQMLWIKINGDASWVENPWVWVVEFKVHKRNVDAMPRIV